MALGVQIGLGRDTATPATQRLVDGLKPAQLGMIVGRSAVKTYRTHLADLNATRPNKLGGARTNFYLMASNGTNFAIAGDFVIVSIPSVGLAQRFFGGTIKPKSGKYLTIPAIPEAHGKRASEFPDLKFELLKGRPALVRKEADEVTQRTRKTSKQTIRGAIKGTNATISVSYGKTIVVFWLKKEVTQKPDPTVLPYDEQVAQKALSDAAAYGQLLWDRANKPSGGDN